MHRCEGDLSYVCKKCDRLRSQKYRDSNRNIVRTNVRKWIKKNKEKRNAYQVKYRKRNREKINAHAALNRAVNSGKIKKQPCSACGNNKSEGHHKDYSKPLDVIWVCRKHHIEIHRKR